jgi:SAM-dependent methyltransferase
MFLRKRRNQASVDFPSRGAKAYSLSTFPLRPTLPLPSDVTREELFEWLKSVRVEGAPDSIQGYCVQDFERFVHTFGLVQRAGCGPGAAGLELGANPYFTTMLLRQFTSIRWDLANYFSDDFRGGAQRVFFDEYSRPGVRGSVEFGFRHFNIERDIFPFESESLDIVLFCEIIEHLVNDPCRVLREIKRVLRRNGYLILTTPNVNRIENVAKMIVGANVSDIYSKHGPYGRHNREYNKHELFMLLTHLGFTVEEMFTADVHENMTAAYLDLEKFAHLIEYRQHDLGQYIFVCAKNTDDAKEKKPSWLYRSYEPDEVE